MRREHSEASNSAQHKPALGSPPHKTVKLQEEDIVQCLHKSYPMRTFLLSSMACRKETRMCANITAGVLPPAANQGKVGGTGGHGFQYERCH
uniref:Uncharacterized protein n=1 Tax=Ascaris lumbricoides TaxID=6252 RepID=A0A0M3I8S5_ASCLU